MVTNAPAPPPLPRSSQQANASKVLSKFEPFLHQWSKVSVSLTHVYGTWHTWVDNISNFHDLRQELVERRWTSRRCLGVFFFLDAFYVRRSRKFIVPFATSTRLSRREMTDPRAADALAQSMVPPPLSLSPGSKTKAGQDPVALEPPA